MPLWRNWQTRTTQNRVGLLSYRFDSDQRHKLKKAWKQSDCFHACEKIESDPDINQWPSPNALTPEIFLLVFLNREIHYSSGTFSFVHFVLTTACCLMKIAWFTSKTDCRHPLNFSCFCHCVFLLFFIFPSGQSQPVLKNPLWGGCFS
jgi:hypothetical protein